MIRGRAPHAVLLVGPAGVGKTTLAEDLAAGLLCTATDPVARPCGTCRACRLVARDRHPDVHRLGPDGPGRQVVIGGSGSRVRGVRDLVAELALMPVDGGARVAIIESAQRMNEDAQAALLKTLEEPPDGVTIVLCADAEEPLLPTIRSRTARLRLGPVGTRDVEAILAGHDGIEPALAARLARLALGRPGLALAWARQPDALRERDELARTLLDLLVARPSERLSAIRAAMARATTLGAIDARRPELEASPAAAPSRTRAIATDPATDDTATAADAADDEGTPTRSPAAERRRAADALVMLWADVARDLALCQRGLARSARDLGLLEETQAIAETVDRDSLTAFLDRLGRAGVLLAGNVSPELVLDDLVLAWPHARRSAVA